MESLYLLLETPPLFEMARILNFLEILWSTVLSASQDGCLLYRQCQTLAGLEDLSNIEEASFDCPKAPKAQDFSCDNPDKSLFNSRGSVDFALQWHIGASNALNPLTGTLHSWQWNPRVIPS